MSRYVLAQLVWHSPFSQEFESSTRLLIIKIIKGVEIFAFGTHSKDAKKVKIDPL